MLWSLAACSSGPSRVASENDRLRAQQVDLEKQIRLLEGRNAELIQQLQAASRGPATVSAEVAEATPHVVAISLGRLSHASDENTDGTYDSIMMYMEPVDGFGRFMQAVGTVTMHAAVLPADGPAQTIGQTSLGPKALRDAYRGSFGAPAYALSMPIKYPPDAAECTVRVVFTDAYTGEQFSNERVIDLR